MKNRIKKRRDSAFLDSAKSPKSAESSEFLADSADSAFKNSALLYNIKSISIIIEILVGAILGIALCLGFFFAFFVVRGSLIFSLGIFFIILIIAAFFVLILKYLFIAVTLKMREIGLLEQVLKGRRI